jgi:hypothetical protein
MSYIRLFVATTSTHAKCAALCLQTRPSRLVVVCIVHYQFSSCLEKNPKK